MNQLQTFIAGLPFGFLTAEQMPELIALDRLHPCLVRCGGCRFTCAAQYVAHLIKCVEAGGDYVRDVSLPVGSANRAATWQADCPVTPASMLPASFLEARKSPAGLVNHIAPAFNPNDCGGVFDGSRVTSDADPGL